VPDDALIGQLETRRQSLVTANREILSAAAGRTMTAEETTAYDGNMTEVRALNSRLDDLRDEAAREARGAAARADGTTTTAGTGDAVTVTREPQIYERYSPHSYFADLARISLKRGDGDGGPGHAEQRLSRHRDELNVELPARRERRARAASRELEAHTQESLSALPSRVRRREERRIEQWLGLGMPVFERRAVSQTPGDGGYFIPPLWLVDEYTEYLRAGRTLANLCHSMPLPTGTNSINMPIITTGSATGPQASDGADVGSRDLADSYVNALVRTIAGQEDVSMQWLDNSPIPVDRVVFKDLTADQAQQVDGQVLLGSGTQGQIAGMYPQGTITGGSTPGIIVNTVTGLTTAQWVGANSFYQGIGQLLSKISRLRYANASGLATNPAAWFAMATSVDGNQRPLVVPAAQGPWNAAAQMSDPDYEGVVGGILGRTWHADNNIPLTFGGATTAPSMASLSAGHTAPVDGTGSGNTFTPAIAAVWDDLLLFEGEVRTRVLQEVLSGTLQVRFQLYNYMAFIPNRYQNGGTVVSYGNANSGTTPGAALSTGASGGLVGF